MVSGRSQAKRVKCLFALLVLNNDGARIKTLACGFTIFLSPSVPIPQTLKPELYVNELLIRENEENKETEGKWKELLNLTEQR